jgi:hypothetical protein
MKVTHSLINFQAGRIPVNNIIANHNNDHAVSVQLDYPATVHGA